MSSSVVGRAASTNAALTSGMKSHEIADVFDVTIYLVSQIDEAITKARKQIENLTAARVGRQLGAMAAANSELRTLLDQSKLMTDSLERVLEFHRGQRGRT